MNDNCIPYDCMKSFRRSSIDSICDECYGVYSFWYRKRCIYVGKAERQPIKVRLMQHWNDCHNEGLKMWLLAKGKEINFVYKVIGDSKRIHILERFYIKKYQPVTNKTR